MRHHAFPNALTRDDLLEWYRAGRARSRQIFDLVRPDAYYDRPIPLRNPIVFYEGHLPAFCVNTVIKLALGLPGVNDEYETLFARGIDPEDEASAKAPTDLWPSREKVQQYGAACDARIEDALRYADLENDQVPQLRNGEAALAILEHEQMHQETLLYMLHALPHEKKVKRWPSSRLRMNHVPDRTSTSASIPAGAATLGTAGVFAWDNELPQHCVDVRAFDIDVHNVTNGQYLEYLNATGAAPPHFWTRGDGEWLWRGMFALEPLNPDAPVYVTHDEAEAYAKWRGRRLPTEAEWVRAAEGTTEGNFGFASLDPVTVGQFAPSRWGVHDLVGNGWEWTSTVFDGFPGFQPMPSYPVYSSDFFDDAHYVMKGASPVTSRELVRPGFRNWFRPNYPYVYATFRTVNELA